MVTRNFAKYIAAAFLAAACTVQSPEQLQAPTESEPVAFSTGSLRVATVEFDDSLLSLIEEELAGGGLPTKSAPLSSVMEELGIRSMERLFPVGGAYEALHRKAGLHRFYIVRFAGQQPVTKAVTDLRSVPGILSVTPPRKIHHRAFFDDPQLANHQWHLVNEDYPEADIHVLDVWKKYTVGNRNVVVAVMDEALALNHPDLKDNLWDDGRGHHGYNPFEQNFDLSWTGNLADGHGTHVAGIIGATNNNKIGVSGIAGGDYAKGIPGVRLMSCQIYLSTNAEQDAWWDYLDEIGEDEDISAPRAFVWSAEHGAVISQNSWGYSADMDDNGTVTREEREYFKSLTLDDFPALKKAIQYFIDYAGCDPSGNQRPDAPMKGGLVFFAAGNEGHYNVDYDPICCSNDKIISVGAFDMDGSAAYYSQYGNWVDVAAPGGGSMGDIWSTLPLEKTSIGYGGRGWMGTSMACPHATGVAALIVSYFGRQGFTADDARDIFLSGLGSRVGTASRPVGKRLNALASFEYGADNYPAGGMDADTPQPPYLQLDESSKEVKAHEVVTVGINAYDPNGDAFTFSCSPGSDAVTFDEDTYTLTITGYNAQPGTYTAVVTARDAGGLESSASLTYTLLPNHAPIALGEVDNILLTGLQKVPHVELDGLFTDPDGETPVVSASTGDTCIGLDVSDNRISIHPKGYGVAEVTISATDFLKESAQITFLVAVVDPSQPVTVQDEVVSTEAVIRIGTEKPVDVSLSAYSSTGALVKSAQLSASAFSPIRLDMSGFAPGRYTVVLTYGGNTYRVRVVKY